MDLTYGMMKGGTAKSTSAVLTALALHRKRGRRVGLVDADVRSQTTTDWCGLSGASWPTDISVFPWHDPEALPHHIARIRPDFPDVVRDTGGDHPDVLEACLVDTDMLICPVAGTGPEYRRVPATLALAAQVAKVRNPNLLVMVLIVKVPRNSVEARTMRGQLADKGIGVFDTEVRHSLTMYARPFGSVPGSLGAYEQLAEEIVDVMGDRA